MNDREYDLTCSLLGFDPVVSAASGPDLITNSRPEWCDAFELALDLPDSIVL
jgi:hypothetical protein